MGTARRVPIAGHVRSGRPQLRGLGGVYLALDLLLLAHDFCLLAGGLGLVRGLLPTLLDQQKHHDEHGYQ